ncbi:MAG: dihydrolipoyl dehydrogenase [Candidatus Bathyarchaeota archaeon]|nr:MAG: dihydrolipoyl dehydrogenase [Candidatus Bathyarchaeota archaeon]
MAQNVDLVVLGGGGAGVYAAARAAKLGATVILVENRRIGGVCLNWGGPATKTLTSTMELLKNVKNGSVVGIQGSVSVDWSTLRKYKDGMCARFAKFAEIALTRSGVTILNGTGEILSPSTVKITLTTGEEELVNTRNILIAVGSQPTTIPGVKLEDPILDSDKLLDLDTPPKTLLVIGGGVVGLEFATIFNLLGTQVTVIELLPTLLPTDEPEVGAFLKRHLKKEGMHVFLESRVTNITPVDDGAEITIQTPTEELTMSTEKVLMAVGRHPNIDLQRLESLGVQTTRRGIIVDNRMQTSVPTIWAAGDVVAPYLLANVAMREAKVAAENIAGTATTINYAMLPRAVFTIPEIAAVGLTEQQARDKGLTVRTGKVNFRAHNFRAAATNKPEGLIKLVTQPDGTLLGATIVGAQASDLIAEFMLALANQMTTKEMSELMYIHPSYSEAILNALETFEGKGLM